jgi:hypothetical protein
VELFAGVGLAISEAVAALDHTGPEGIGKHLGVVTADHLLPPQTEHPLGDSVDRDHAPVRITGKEAVGEVLQGRAEGLFAACVGEPRLAWAGAPGVFLSHCPYPLRIW